MEPRQDLDLSMCEVFGIDDNEMLSTYFHLLRDLELRHVLAELEQQQEITVSGRKPRERKIRGPHVLAR
jgi:hypothetical protein